MFRDIDEYFQHLITSTFNSHMALCSWVIPPPISRYARSLHVSWIFDFVHFPRCKLHVFHFVFSCLHCHVLLFHWNYMTSIDLEQCDKRQKSLVTALFNISHSTAAPCSFITILYCLWDNITSTVHISTWPSIVLSILSHNVPYSLIIIMSWEQLTDYQHTDSERPRIFEINTNFIQHQISLLNYDFAIVLHCKPCVYLALFLKLHRFMSWLSLNDLEQWQNCNDIVNMTGQTQLLVVLI